MLRRLHFATWLILGAASATPEQILVLLCPSLVRCIVILARFTKQQVAVRCMYRTQQGMTAKQRSLNIMLPQHLPPPTLPAGGDTQPCAPASQPGCRPGCNSAPCGSRRSGAGRVWRHSRGQRTREGRVVGWERRQQRLQQLLLGREQTLRAFQVQLGQPQPSVQAAGKLPGVLLHPGSWQSRVPFRV